MTSTIISIGDEERYWMTVDQNPKAVIKFTATWCGPCKKIAPFYKKLAQDHKDKGIIFAELDVDDFDDSTIVQDLGISGIPAFVTFHDGDKVDKMAGASEEKLSKLVEDLREK